MSYSFNLHPTNVVRYYRSRPSGIVTSSVVDSHYMYYGNGNKTSTVKRAKPAVLQRDWTSFNGTKEEMYQTISLWVGPDTSAGQEWWIGPFIKVAVPGSVSTTPTRLTEAGGIVNGKLRLKIRDSNLNLAQSLGEYRQTSKLAVSLMTDVVKTFRSLHPGKAIPSLVKAISKPANKLEKSVANRWLEYQYGVRPLMNDIYGSAEALAVKIRSGFPMYVSQKAFVEWWWTEEVQYATKHWYEYSYNKKKVRYVIRDATLKQLSQVGVLNPALLIWELIPYSFVFDWIFPVGKFLESLDALSGVEDILVFESQFGLKSIRAVGKGLTGHCEGWTKSSVRKPAANYLGFPRLRYKPSESLLAVTNGLALISQLRGGNFATLKVR